MPKSKGCLIAAGAFAGIVALIIVFVLVGWAGRWGAKAAEVTGPQNVEHQFAKAYQLYEGMPSLEANIEAQQAEIDSIKEQYGERPWPEDVRKRFARTRSRLTAYITQYNRLARQYNAQMRDVFQGKVVGPSDLPDRVSTYERP